MKALSKEEVINKLPDKNWIFVENSIRREFKFNNFIETFSFMTAIAFEAEKMDHHPDWSNSYNKLHIELTTHSENGVTQNDLDLAAKINAIFSHYTSG